MRKTFIILIVFIWFLIYPQTIRANELESGSAADLRFNQSNVDPRVEILTNYLTDKNSDLADKALILVTEADRVHIDWRLLTAIAGLESTFCKHIPSNSYNCWGWGIPSGSSSGIGFKNYPDAISTISQGLRENYIDRGLVTIDQIGSRYAASQTWSIRVKKFMADIDNWQPLAYNSGPQIDL